MCVYVYKSETPSLEYCWIWCGTFNILDHVYFWCKAAIAALDWFIVLDERFLLTCGFSDRWFNGFLGATSWSTRTFSEAQWASGRIKTRSTDSEWRSHTLNYLDERSLIANLEFLGSSFILLVDFLRLDVLFGIRHSPLLGWFWQLKFH